MQTIGFTPTLNGIGNSQGAQTIPPLFSWVLGKSKGWDSCKRSTRENLSSHMIQKSKMSMKFMFLTRKKNDPPNNKFSTKSSSVGESYGQNPTNSLIWYIVWRFYGNSCPWIKVLSALQTKSQVKTRWRQPMSWNPWDVFERRPTKYEQNLYQNIDVYLVIFVVSLLVAIPKKNLVNSEGEAWQIGKSPFLFAHPWGTTSPSRWRWALWSQRFETSSDRHQQITRRRWQTTVVVVVVDFFCGIQERRKQSKTINPAWSGSLLIMISMIFFNEFHMIDTSSLCSFIGEYSVSKTVEFIKMLGFLDARLISRHPAQRDAEHRFGGPRTN